MANKTGSYWAFFRGASGEAELFAMPWWYYFAKLRYDLGWLGLIFFLGGLLALLPAGKDWHWSRLPHYLQRTRMMPVYLLLPAYAALALSHGKPPWLTISLQPWLALSVGLGWVFLTGRAVQCFPALQRKTAARYKLVAQPALLGLLLLLQVWNFNYPQFLARMCVGQMPAIKRAYVTAEALNRICGYKDGILIMPDLFRGGATALDPILFWNTGNELRIYRNMDPRDFDIFTLVIRQKRIKWALLFPRQGSTQANLVRAAQEKINPRIYLLPQALLMEVDSLWSAR